jgi:hypothetical protein
MNSPKITFFSLFHTTLMLAGGFVQTGKGELSVVWVEDFGADNLHANASLLAAATTIATSITTTTTTTTTITIKTQTDTENGLAAGISMCKGCTNLQILYLSYIYKIFS